MNETTAITNRAEPVRNSEISISRSADAGMASMIERVALDPNLPIERLEKLLDMQERIQKEQRAAEFARAKSLAMAEMPNIPMNGVGHNNKRYATLKDITSTTRPVLSTHGLTLDFDVQEREGGTYIAAVLTHANGHEKRVGRTYPNDGSGSKNAIQAMGSAQTYGQRYMAQAILGLSLGDDTEDDGKGQVSVSTITEAQLRELKSEIERAGIDEQIICTAEQIGILPELPASKFAMVMGKLKETGR